MLKHPKVTKPFFTIGGAEGTGVGRPLVAQEATRQPIKLLGVELLGLTERIGPGIGQPIVHGPKAGGVRIAEIGDLNRGRLAGENTQPVRSRMPGQIHQDVDLVVADHVADVDVGQAADIAPSVGHRGEAFGRVVGSKDVAVADDVKRGRVAIGEDGLDKRPHRMSPKIAGDVSDAYLPFGRGLFSCRRISAVSGDACALGPLQVLGEKRLCVVLPLVVEVQQQVAVGRGRRRSQRRVWR